MSLASDNIDPASSPVVLITAGYDHTLRFWEALSGFCDRILQHPESQVNSLAITRDKRFVAAAGNPHVRFFDACSPRPDPLHVYDGHNGNVTSVGFQRDYRWMYTSSEDGTLKIWDTRTTKCQRTYENKTGGMVHAAVLHPNQAELFAVDHNGTIRLWDLSANTCTMELTTEDVPLSSLTISADGTTLCASNHHGKIFVWNLVGLVERSDLSPVHIFEAHATFVTKCLLSPEGSKLATCSADNTIKLWNVDQNFALDSVLTGHQKWVWDCVFSADSAYLISASSDHSARLWDLKTGDPIRHYIGHDKAVVAIAMNDIPG